MPNCNKSRKQKKAAIECGFGEKCARRNCTFSHPETRNLQANLRRIQQEQQENVAHLVVQQMATIVRACRHGDRCRQPSCPSLHSPQWDPIKNQRLAEDKHRHDEKRREEQQQYALKVCLEEETSGQSKYGQHQQRKNSMSDNSIGDEYQYDDTYFDVYGKVWKKQDERLFDKW